MRFEQLKRIPNTILRKKMYKAGKNWVIASTLTFIGGVTLLSSQALNVKADDENSNAVQTEAVNSQTPQKSDSNEIVGSQPTQKETSSDNSDANSSSSGTLDNEKNNDSEQPTDVSENNNGSVNSGSTADNQQMQTTNSNYQSPVPASTNTDSPVTQETGGIDDLNNIASSDDPMTGGNIGAGTLADGTKTTGSSWYINKDKVLHISGGKWAPVEFGFNWGGKLWEAEKIHFDGKVIAGASINGLFRDAWSISDTGNMEDYLDISNTNSFKEMFERSGLTSFDFSTLNFSNITDMSSMFDSCDNLQTVNLSNIDLSNADINSMFKDDVALKSINMSDAKASEVTNMSNLFTGDVGLTSIDFSNFTVKGNNVSEMLKFKDGISRYEPGIESLKLNPKLNLQGSDLTFNEHKYKGWVSDSNPDADPVSSDYLMEMYDGSTPIDVQTWTLAKKPEVNYTVNYYEGNKLIKQGTFSVVDGELGMIPRVPNYNFTKDENDSVTADYLSGSSKTIDVQVQYAEPYKLGINITYDNDPAKSQTITITIPVNPGKLEDFAEIEKQLDQLPNNNDSWNKGATEFNANGLIGEDPDFISLKDLDGDTGIPGISAASVDLKHSIIYLLDNFPIPLDKGGEVGDFVKVSYAKYEAPETPSDNNGSGSSASSSSTTEPDREIDDINQTSATYSDQPKVQLYDYDGNLIDGAFLNPNTSWYNDKKMILNGKTYYRVSIGKWVSADDVYVYVANNTYVRVYEDNYGHITNIHGKTLNRELKPATDWFSDRTVYINGEKYYRVATDEFVNANNVYEYTYDSPVISTNKVTSVYDEKGNQTTIQLPTNSSYKTDRYETINGDKYYRVATNEFVKAEDVNL